ncbi:CREB-regulated transcription coactivator 1-like isoform X2 [Palaemon carinicauda]|uniref:CREB-regulated transcription coactivator 1-like isoform X2 n=1 Tax=Palaemon carinicauda TaxID=392227 RepID=UPI0035B6961F
MATPSPRKFQEKIALLQQRELEGKIEFEQIMTDVQGLTRAPKPTPQPKQHLQIQQQHHHLQHHPQHQHQQQQHALKPPQGGSLPDFSINLPVRGPSYYHQGSLQGAVQEVQDLHEAVYHGSNCTPHQRTSPSSQARHHPHTSNLSTSPRLHYPSTLLSPPEVLPRSSSDSSLHQNLVQGKMVVNNRKVSAPAEMRTDQGFGMQFYTHDLQLRPKSGCELTLPGDSTTINHIQRSQNIPIPATINNVGGAGPGGGVAGGGGGGQLPNTGSLPDLTQVQYLQPMNPPLPDTDTMNLSNLTAGSPRLGSGFTAGSLKDHYNSSGQASPRGTSPGPSPSLNRKQKQKPYQTIYTNRGSHHTQSKNHLSVPTVINARYLHKCKGMTVDNSSTTVDTHLANSGFNIYGQPLSPNSSHPASPGMTIDNCSTTVDTHRANSGLNIFGAPLSPNNSHPASPNHLSFMDYRNPVSPQLSPRSSPGPSHTLHTGGLGSFSSNSPSDSRSAPPSPSAPQASPASSPGVSLSKTPFNYEYPTHAQTNQLNQQFEQCNMIDNSPGSNNSYTSGNTTLQQQTRLMEMSVESAGSGYFSNTASSSPSGPPPAYPNVSSQQLTQNLSQSVSQAHSQTHSQPSGPPPPYPQTSSSSSTHHHQQSQQQSQHHQHCQQQPQPHSSPSNPQHISQSPSHSHHPPSPVQPLSSQHPPSPGQGPLSPQSNPSSIQHPPTPQTPQTPTLIPSVVLTMPDEAGTESERLLQDDMSFSEMFGSVISYEQGSFESDILENMSRLDENELNMMVDQGTVDQLLVDQETEESFRRDHRSASSTSSGP